MVLPIAVSTPLVAPDLSTTTKRPGDAPWAAGTTRSSDVLAGPCPCRGAGRGARTASQGQAQRKQQGGDDGGHRDADGACPERAPGASISPPVFGSTGEVVAALGIGAPTRRLTPADVGRLAPSVVEAAAEASRCLGYRPGIRDGAGAR
ncbi:IclR family transcriptional regulator C-terminal domain-containing protein [Streptomyces sp. NPDC088354]|uniref:IclR family transcriptional regulator domain-containing protein n=1 Tax=Streptomyces sp. NPDC088354 TaxID=3365856 RepID=UPI0037FD2301